VAPAGAKDILMEERMDPRVSTVESDIAAVRATLEAMRANYATNVSLAETEGRLRLEIVKVDKKIELVAADQRHHVDLVAADLKVEFHKAVGAMHASMLTTAIALFAIYGAMFIGIVKYLVP
jgi:outer membrane protein TolC